MGATINNESPTTEKPPKNRQQPKSKHYTGTKTFAIEYVVKAHNHLFLHGGFLTIAM